VTLSKADAGGKQHRDHENWFLHLLSSKTMMLLKDCREGKLLKCKGFSGLAKNLLRRETFLPLLGSYLNGPAALPALEAKRTLNPSTRQEGAK
jgi:hypothetical protein